MRLKIYGPPGAGKTTSLAALTQNAVQRHGEGVIVASLTRSAAAEIAGRGLNLPRENVGTLHHHCYRALGNPPLVIKHLSEWNDAHPIYAVSPDQSDEPGDVSRWNDNYPGDELMASYEMLRHHQRPRDLWPLGVRVFAEAWEAWKTEATLLDFTDLLEDCLASSEGAPWGATAGIFDEVQDFSRLEFALLEKWAQSLESIALAGDDDQAVYQFRGADPGSMIAFPSDEIRVLPQSHRCPDAVHALSQPWIKQLTERMEKDFKARDEAGWVRPESWSFEDDADEILADACGHVEAGKTVMLLASCEYMLRPVVSEARRLGIPFHNPYRRRARQWNPLYVAKGTGAGQRLLTYLRPRADVWGEDARMWLGSDVAAFSQPLRADLFGGRAPVAALEAESEVSDQWLANHLADESFLDLTPSAYERHILPSELRWFIYPLAVAERNPKLLKEQPKLVIGTIHSVKGGEADVVYLSPELSPAQSEEWDSYPDSLIRLFYVGMTRAREGLVLLSAGARRECCDDLVELVG